MCKSATTVSETASWLDDLGKLFYFPACIRLPQLKNSDDDTHTTLFKHKLKKFYIYACLE